MVRPSNSLLGRVLLSAPAVWAALDLDINNDDSIKKAAALVAEDLMGYYNGEKPGEIPGLLPGPPPNSGDYYWWTGGLLWNTLIDYRNVTGDAKYTDSIVKGMAWQTGQKQDFMPANYSLDMTNSDQAVWANAALAAAMSGLPKPSSPDAADWLQLARNVVTEQSLRAVNSNGTCSGALRWAVLPMNAGYNYLDTNSNAGHFALAAALAHETKNDTLAKQAASGYELMTKIGLIDDKFNVFDGIRDDCKAVNQQQFSQNAGLLLTGSAYMLQQTNGDETWKKRVDGLVARTLEVFFPNGVAKEVACEGSTVDCVTDMKLFKGMLHRGLGVTMQLAPHAKDKILPVLKTSAAAAARTCANGKDQRLCSVYWASNSNQKDGATLGAAAQLDVLNALNSVLMASVQSGGSSSGAAGGSGGNGDAGAAGAKKDGPGSMGTATSVSTAAVFGGLFLGVMALF
ncbi:glycoside hydrolase family 76 protein [Apiospora kogelbergensis]|uniref:Mannan endo-1,6-alpha-mannosidase n=1 Tax=Apiospora kogelbergensis TaxID=1337665 RepID=A0AAW0RA57_9PEZI